MLTIEYMDHATSIEREIFFFKQIPSDNSVPECCDVVLLCEKHSWFRILMLSIHSETIKIIWFETKNFIFDVDGCGTGWISRNLDSNPDWAIL